MRLHRPALAGLLALLAAADLMQSGRAFGGTSIRGAPCGITAGRDVIDSPVTCKYDLTPMQLRQVIDEIVKDKTDQSDNANVALINRIESISETLGVTRQAAKALLRSVGDASDVPDDKIAEELTKVAQYYKILQAEAADLNPDNSEARKLVAQARDEINAGRLDHADQLLNKAANAQVVAAQKAYSLSETAKTSGDSEMLAAASSAAIRASVALTELDYRQAAELFSKAASYVPPGYPDQRFDYLDGQASALEQLGSQIGDNNALRNSIDIYNEILKGRSRDRDPLNWAMTQNNLGNTLEKLGELEPGTQYLEQAVAAYQAALQEWDPHLMPIPWAAAEGNLGAVWEKLGERKGVTAYQVEAANALGNALRVVSRESAPRSWAITQVNLGNVLVWIGEREEGTAVLAAAVTSYESALEVITREDDPVGWALTLTELGIALESLGKREAGTAHLEEAVMAFQAALGERTRDRLPLDWAYTKNGLGTALAAIGERETGTAQLQEGAAEFQAALEQFTPYRAPTQWAETQINLGLVLEKLSERDRGPGDLEAAIAAFRAALEVITPNNNPPDFAKVEQSLRQAVAMLNQREAETSH